MAGAYQTLHTSYEMIAISRRHPKVVAQCPSGQFFNIHLSAALLYGGGAEDQRELSWRGTTPKITNQA